MAKSDIVTAALLIIGNEILSGRTKDANLGYLAECLTDMGIRLSEVRVVPDIEDEIIAAVNALRAKFTYVFTTGGIGPTHDDITAGSVAKAFGLPLIEHEEARAILERRYAETGVELNEARLRMARTPEGAALIENPVSGAPGFQVGNVFVMAGVPKIMQAMFNSLRDRLTGGPPLLSRGISCNLPEGTLAKGLGEIQARHKDVDIGSYPSYSMSGFRVTLVLRHTDAAVLQIVVDDVISMIGDLGGAYEEQRK